MMRDPDFVGPGGRAWAVNDPRHRRTPDHEACLYGALLHVPGAHPLWSWYMLGICHLRPVPGVPPAKRHFPGAEYELVIFAIDPATQPDPDAPPWRLLDPVDICEQWGGVTDAQASEMGEKAVLMIVHGHASPDQDWRRWWHETLQNTLEHIRTGGHHGDGDHPGRVEVIL